MTSVKTLPGAKPRGVIFLLDYSQQKQLKLMSVLFRILEISAIHLRTFLKNVQAFDISVEPFGWLIFIPLALKHSLRNLHHEFGASVKQLSYYRGPVVYNGLYHFPGRT